MAHVLGLGTLWSAYKCGTKCTPTTTSPSNTTSDTYKYDCIGAKDEYEKMVLGVKAPILMISSNDCAHWSGMSYEDEKCVSHFYDVVCDQHQSKNVFLFPSLSLSLSLSLCLSCIVINFCHTH